ncbi:MAG TPA: CHASE2 domain-containing protein [Pyrinomonadaceae bacterium]|nr:CHASE2 domain-containing protein [Pyrinomonadaceae bacterium]
MKPENDKPWTRKLRSIFNKVDARTWAIISVPLLTGLVVCFLSIVHFFNLLGLEDFIQGYSVRYMKDYTAAAKFDKRIKIFLIGETPVAGTAPSGDIDPKHREFFSKLIRAMTQARAKVLAFDIAFEYGSPFDAELGAAIAEAEKNNLKVIVGIDEFSAEQGTDPAIPTGFGHPRWGTILVGGSRGGDGRIGTIKLAEFNAAGSSPDNPTVIPSLALRSVMEASDPALEPEFDDGRLNLLLYRSGPTRELFRSIPLDREEGLILDEVSQREIQDARKSAQGVETEFSDPAALSKYKDAIVLVGYEQGEMQTLLTGEKRLGVDIHASAISNILNGIFISRLSPLHNFFIIFFMALLGAALHSGPGKWIDFKLPVPIPWTSFQPKVPIVLVFIAALYILAAFLAYKVSRVYLDVCYHIAALLISYAGLWFVLDKWFSKQEPIWKLNG